MHCICYEDGTHLEKPGGPKDIRDANPILITLLLGVFDQRRRSSSENPRVRRWFFCVSDKDITVSVCVESWEIVLL